MAISQLGQWYYGYGMIIHNYPVVCSEYKHFLCRIIIK